MFATFCDGFVLAVLLNLGDVRRVVVAMGVLLTPVAGGFVAGGGTSGAVDIAKCFKSAEAYQSHKDYCHTYAQSLPSLTLQ